MVKKENIRFQDLLKIFYKFDIFTKSINYKVLILYNLVCLVLLGILGILSNNIENYSEYTNVGIFFFGIIGMPILLLLFFVLFYIFFNAFSINKRKGFFESYLVFLSICCPFILLGNIFNIIGKWSLNYFFVMLSIFLLFVILVYFMISFVLNFKNYANDSSFKVMASIILSIIVIFMFTLTNYVLFLVSSLQ